MNGIYRFEKIFLYGISDIPSKFQEKKDQTLNYQTPVSLEDTIMHQGDEKKHQK